MAKVQKPSAQETRVSSQRFGPRSIFLRGPEAVGRQDEPRRAEGARAAGAHGFRLSGLVEDSLGALLTASVTDNRQQIMNPSVMCSTS